VSSADEPNQGDKGAGGEAPDRAVSDQGALVIEHLGERVGGAALLDLARDHDGLYLVGGAVRDLLLGRTPRELDVVVEGAVAPVATELARRLGVTAVCHDRFGTATVPGDERVDLASARTETYPVPGALPEIRPGATLGEDLRRRDFSVNALAVGLSRSNRGALVEVPGALEDLDARRLRILHDESFHEDPTRLLRLARYRCRLDFDVEGYTAELARQAIEGGALAPVSGSRLGAELRLALAEGCLVEMGRLGILSAMLPGLTPDAELTAAACGLLAAACRGPTTAGGRGPTAAHAQEPVAVREDLVELAAAARRLPPAPLRSWLESIELTAAERDLVLSMVTAAPVLAQRLAQARRPSEVRVAVGRLAVEVVALAGALGPASTARDWLRSWRHISLEITGDDLLAAGCPPGPEVGRRLEAVLARKLDGELGGGRDAELAAGLAG
jgi:tRNA nucleotidyltransferase (CCA-adding enzyme)